MPHDAPAAVAVRPGRLDGRLDRSVDCPVLVVLGDPLDEPLGLVAENNEVLHDVQKAVLIEYAFDQYLDRRQVRDYLTALDRLPRRVVLKGPGERAHRRSGAVTDDRDRVGREECRDVLAVG